MSKLFRTTLWILSGVGLIAFLVQTLSTFLISPLMGLLSLLIAAIPVSYTHLTLPTICSV